MTYIVIGDGSTGSGTVEAIINLEGVIDADGLFVVAEDTFSLAVAATSLRANVSLSNASACASTLPTNTAVCLLLLRRVTAAGVLPGMARRRRNRRD